jgi:hypothetical protein
MKRSEAPVLNTQNSTTRQSTLESSYHCEKSQKTAQNRPQLSKNQNNLKILNVFEPGFSK